MPRDVNTVETVGERMTTEQLAASAYRAGTYASQAEPSVWGMLEELDRRAWLRMADQAKAILTENEGKSYIDAAMRLQRAYAGEGHSPVPDRTGAVVWEAVARHLVQLLDDDEIDDLEALEQSWRGWASKRLQTEEKPP